MSAAVLNPIPGTLASLNLTAEPCGSRVTVSPEPQASDYDYLVVIPADRGVVSDVVSGLDAAGFKWEGDEHYQDAAGNFMSWRKDDVNLIVTSNPSFAERHRVATGICKRLNLADKADRVAVFQGVLYGNLEALAARDQTP